MASSLDGMGEHERVQRLLAGSAKFSMMILLPVALTFLIRGSSFIGLWMGPSYAELSGAVLAILSLPLLVRAGAHRCRRHHAGTRQTQAHGAGYAD